MGSPRTVGFLVTPTSPPLSTCNTYLSTHNTPRMALLSEPALIATAIHGQPCWRGSEKKCRRLESALKRPLTTAVLQVSMTSHDGLWQQRYRRKRGGGGRRVVWEGYIYPTALGPVDHVLHVPPTLNYKPKMKQSQGPTIP